MSAQSTASGFLQRQGRDVPFSNHADQWYVTLYGSSRIMQTRVSSLAELKQSIAQAMAADIDFGVSRYPV